MLDAPPPPVAVTGCEPAVVVTPMSMRTEARPVESVVTLFDPTITELASTEKTTERPTTGFDAASRTRAVARIMQPRSTSTPSSVTVSDDSSDAAACAGMATEIDTAGTAQADDTTRARLVRSPSVPEPSSALRISRPPRAGMALLPRGSDKQKFRAASRADDRSRRSGHPASPALHPRSRPPVNPVRTPRPAVCAECHEPERRDDEIEPRAVGERGGGATGAFRELLQ